MKKFLSLAMAAFVATAPMAQAVEVETDEELNLVCDGTGLYLSSAPIDGNNQVYQAEAEADGCNQVFIFVDAPAGAEVTGYNIKTGDGQYVIRDSWNIFYAASPDLKAKNSIFTVEEKDGLYRIKNAGSNKYIGADKFEHNAKVYSDKDGNLTLWFTFETLSTEVKYDKLEAKIAEAEALLKSVTIGNEPGQYPQAAADALTAAIATAREGLKAQTRAEVSEAVKALASAIDRFKHSKVPAEFADGIYKFGYVAVDGGWLANGYHANSWEASKVEMCALLLAETDCVNGYRNKYTVYHAEEGAEAAGYNIADTEGYLLYNEGGNLYWGDVDAKSKDAIFIFEEDGDNFKIKSVATDKYVGPNNDNTPWIWIHLGTNHSGVRNEHLFTATQVEAWNNNALKQLIGDAQALLDNTAEGTEPDQYPAAARTALTNAITAATAALTGTPAAVRAAQLNLTKAIQTYKDNKIPAIFAEGMYMFESVGLPGTYISNGWHANSWEASNVQSCGLLLERGEEGYNQLFMVSNTSETAAAQGYTIRDKDGYYLFNDNGALLYSETEETDPTDINSIFIFEESGDAYKIKSAATGKYVGPNDDTKGWSWIHLGTKHSGAQNGNLYRPLLQGGSVSEMLQKTIDEAEQLLASTTEGNEPGQYSAEARASLTKAIAAAKEALGGADEDVMLANSALANAIEIYKASVEPPFFKEGVYKFHHTATGAVLCSGWHANSWESQKVLSTALIINEDEAGEYNTRFTVLHSAPDADYPGYTIMDAEGHVLYNDGGALLYNEENNYSSRSEHALFVFETEGDKVLIRSVATGKYVGPDDSKKGWSWQHVGTRHDGTEDGNVFTAEFLEEAGVANVAVSEISIAAAAGAVAVEGAAHVAVYTAAGVQVGAAAGDSVRIALPAGMYIVRAANGADVRTAKVIVR